MPLSVYEKFGMETSKADSYVWTAALCFNTAKLFRHQSQQMMTFLIVEADFLLLEPLQDHKFDGVVRWKTLTSKMFLKFAQCGEVCRDNSGLHDGWGSYSQHQMPNRSSMA
jgi:hypothetical protein